MEEVNFGPVFNPDGSPSELTKEMLEGTGRLGEEPFSHRRLTLDEDPSGVINEISEEVEAGDAPIYTRNDLVRFFNWLTTNTDTFDRIMVQIEREDGVDHTLDPDLVEDLVREFVTTINGE